MMQPNLPASRAYRATTKQRQQAHNSSPTLLTACFSLKITHITPYHPINSAVFSVVHIVIFNFALAALVGITVGLLKLLLPPSSPPQNNTNVEYQRQLRRRTHRYLRDGPSESAATSHASRSSATASTIPSTREREETELRRRQQRDRDRVGRVRRVPLDIVRDQDQRNLEVRYNDWSLERYLLGRNTRNGSRIVGNSNNSNSDTTSLGYSRLDTVASNTAAIPNLNPNERQSPNRNPFERFDLERDILRLRRTQETLRTRQQAARGEAGAEDDDDDVYSSNNNEWRPEAVPLLQNIDVRPRTLNERGFLPPPITAASTSTRNRRMDIPDIVEMPQTVYSKEEWDTKADEISIPKSVLNNVVMNYLIIHGYQSTAQKFSQEADIVSVVKLKSLGERREIMRLINDGKIQTAVEKINEVDPELLDTDSTLHFSLLRMQLIELIREGFAKGDDFENIQPAIDFATNYLAGRAPSDPQLLRDLETTMALLCFAPDNMAPQLKELMDFKMRKKIANDINVALMRRQGLAGDAKVSNLVKLWGWGERLLGNEHVEFPELQAAELF